MYQIWYYTRLARGNSSINHFFPKKTKQNKTKQILSSKITITTLKKLLNILNMAHNSEFLPQKKKIIGQIIFKLGKGFLFCSFWCFVSLFHMETSPWNNFKCWIVYFNASIVTRLLPVFFNSLDLSIWNSFQNVIKYQLIYQCCFRS